MTTPMDGDASAAKRARTSSTMAAASSGLVRRVLRSPPRGTERMKRPSTRRIDTPPPRPGAEAEAWGLGKEESLPP